MEKIYPTVKIGNYYWMMKNLSENKFRNGDLIQEVYTSAEWKIALDNKIPAFKKHPDKENQEIFGYYYNYFAIIDKRNLAPKGFEIASQYYWDDLIDELGGEKEAGYKMKTTHGWKNRLNLFLGKGNGSNESGFSAFPCGNLSNTGNISYINEEASWLSLLGEFDPKYKIRHGKVYSINFKNDTIFKWGGNPDVFGFNIRCIVENKV